MASQRVRARPLANRCRGGMLTEKNLARIRSLNTIAEGRGQTLAQMALVWALRDARITSLVIGASSVKQLQDNVAAFANTDFDSNELGEIDLHATESGVDLWRRSSTG